MDEKTLSRIKGMKPFNLSLLNLNDNNLYKLLGQITSTSMFDGANHHLHPDGLWSPRIFGEAGSPDRLKRQAWIDLKLPILHPLIYRELTSASSLIAGIMAGKEYAKFNPETHFFERSNAIDGKTGYAFFMSCLPKMVLPDTGTIKRRSTIKLLEKNKGNLTIDKFIVLQAGYRDIEFKDGQVNHDEINQIYRELLSLSNSITPSHLNNIELLDNVRYNMQLVTYKLFMYLGEMVGHGKKKLIQGKWASRNVFNGTANVITATKPSGRFAGDPRDIQHDTIMVGLFQQMVGNGAFTTKALMDSFLKDIFVDPTVAVKLVNKKSLKGEEVYVASEWFDLFQSKEGLEKLVQRFRSPDIRHQYLEVDGRYLALVYKGRIDGKDVVKVFNGIEELPSDLSRDDVHPITFIEALYIAVADAIDNIPGYSTRYPITGIESNTVGHTKVFTTTRAEVRYRLNDDWVIDETLKPLPQYPIYGLSTINSMAAPVMRLPGMGGDHDGDRTSLITSMTVESRRELEEYMLDKRAYVGPDGKLRDSVSYDTIEFVCKNFVVFEGE